MCVETFKYKYILKLRTQKQLSRIHKHFKWKVVFDQCSTNLIETISVILSNLVTDNIVVYTKATII